MRKKITRYTSSVNEVNALGTRISTLTDKELQDKTISLTKNNRSVFMISKIFDQKLLLLSEKLLLGY